MNYKYTLIYQVLGLIISDDKNKTVLLEDSTDSTHFKAFLSNNLDDYCSDIDTRSVIAEKFLSGLSGTFKSHIEETQKQRKEKFADSSFLIFEARGDDSSFILKDEVDKGDYIVCLDNDTGKFSKEQYQNQINSVLSSLCITIDTFYKVNKVGGAVVYYNDAGKPIHNLILSFSGKMFSSRKMLDTEVDTLKNHSSVLSNNGTFSTVCRLLAKSIDGENDALLSYLSAWTALELFVHTAFELIKLEPNLEQTKKLTDRFTVICRRLNGPNECADIKSFKKLYTIRNKCFHTGKIDTNSLPTIEIQTMLRKYLVLQLQKRDTG
ncbi:MAG: HEPN domain-containing protein [Thermodesulfovibrionales bacterium]|nr:HEPN domain-containing protein [Thermodesulfovibrionales bacterium]